MAPAREKGPRPSSFVLKQTMAVTGVVFVGFVVVHLFGNLKVFAGADSFNHYAAWLREVGYPLLPKQSVLRGCGSCCWSCCAPTSGRRSPCGCGPDVLAVHTGAACGATVASQPDGCCWEGC